MDTVRQLSAIMFADIVGYTAMMQQSEAVAVASRDRFRDVLSEMVKRHHGTTVQHYGDGTLVTFPSAVEASACAVAIQETLTREPRVPLRIGLHVGDIVRDSEGVYGDGVNVASRVQALAVSGSVLVSDRVAAEVRNHEAVRLVPLGTYQLKNVRDAVAVYAISAPRIVVPEPADLPQDVPAKRSVAVLPFVNMSGDPDIRFFSDGVSEEIINTLAQLPDLKVTSRTSSFAFRGKESDVREIGRTLDVGHILEGSVRRAGTRVRVTAQLIEAASGFHLFSKRWDRDLDDAFAIQDELAQAIADHLRAAFSSGSVPATQSPARAAPDPEAYALYLEGRHHWNSWSPEGARRSIDLYKRALRLDPSLARAHVGLASSYVFLGALGRIRSVEAYGQARAAAKQALALKPGSSEAEVALAMTAIFYEWDAAQADRHLQRALESGPGSATVHHFHGMCSTILLRHSTAIAAMTRARDLDPLSPAIGNDLARSLLSGGQAKEALAQIERTLELAPNFRTALESQAMIYWALGDLASAIRSAHAYRARSPSPYAGAATLGFLLARSGDTAGAEEQLGVLEKRELEEPEVSVNVDFALWHMGAGEYDKALERLERAVDLRDPGALFMWSFPAVHELAEMPRFKALKHRIGLWG